MTEPRSTNLLADAYRILAQMSRIDRHRVARALENDEAVAIVLLFKEGQAMHEIALRYDLELAQVEEAIRRRLP